MNPLLYEAMKVAHSSNPAARSAEKLIKFLDFCPGLNRTEMFGLLKGSYESPSTSRTMSQQLLRHVLVFIAKAGAHTKYEDYWKELKNSFDQELCRQWRQAQSNRIPRINFVRAHRLGLSLIVPMEVCTKVITDVVAEKDPGASEVVQLQKCGSIGAELFSCEVMKVEMLEFVASIDRRITELEHLDFDPDEVRNFRALMMHAAENLDSEVCKEFDGKTNRVKLLDATVGQTVANSNDEWQDRSTARAKTLAISNCQVERTAWEKMLWGDSAHVEDVATTVSVPDSLLFDAMNAREYINTNLFGQILDAGEADEANHHWPCRRNQKAGQKFLDGDSVLDRTL